MPSGKVDHIRGDPPNLCDIHTLFIGACGKSLSKRLITGALSHPRAISECQKYGARTPKPVTEIVLKIRWIFSTKIVRLKNGWMIGCHKRKNV